MGYNNGNGQRAPTPASAPTLKRSRAERIRHFALFAALPLVLGALAGGVTLALPGDPSAALRDVFSAAYINGVAAITVAGVLQMWFTMGETQRADYEQARADWERARADNESAKARKERAKFEAERIKIREERVKAIEEERAKLEEERAKANEMRLLLANERARIAAIEAARAGVEAASAAVNMIAEERVRADAAAAAERAQYDALIAAAEGDERVELQREQAVRGEQRAEYAAQVNQELLRAMRNLNESQQVLNRLLTDHSNGSSA